MRKAAGQVLGGSTGGRTIQAETQRQEGLVVRERVWSHTVSGAL